MCFSNLPVEFDESGDPYLAAEAEDVEHVADCGRGTDVAIDEDDPEAVFEAVASTVPESVREEQGWRLDDPPEGPTEGDEPGDGRADERADGD